MHSREPQKLLQQISVKSIHQFYQFMNLNNQVTMLFFLYDTDWPFELFVAPCLSQPCLHGGYCTQRGSQFSCQCRQGYSGINCEIEDLPAEIDSKYLCQDLRLLDNYAQKTQKKHTPLTQATLKALYVSIYGSDLHCHKTGSVWILKGLKLNN